jgi:hypothetical protein
MMPSIGGHFYLTGIDVTHRANLLKSIAAMIADYRSGEILAPTPEHIDRWIGQFDAAVQVSMLAELAHTL